MKKNIYFKALISLVLIIGITLISCGNSSPSSVVRQFHTAIERDDQKALAELLTMETIQTFSMFYEKIKGTLIENGKVTKTEETINGNNAVVIVTYANGTSDKFNLVKQDGKWKIHQTK